MHWLPADPRHPPVAATGNLLHLWWWPEDRQPPYPDRRARIDAILRLSLAAYAGIAPDTLRFAREPKGRPFLADPDAPDFNLTDTAGGTLVAVCRGARVGVDIERHGRPVSARALAGRWFAPEEARALLAQDDSGAQAMFLRLWTAKEAACKATGTGIYGWLPHWRFDPASEEPRLLAAPTGAGAPDEWSFLRLAPPGGTHTAALAARGALPPALAFVVAPT